MKILLIRFKYVAGERSGTDKWQSSGGHLPLVKPSFQPFQSAGVEQASEAGGRGCATGDRGVMRDR